MADGDNELTKSSQERDPEQLQSASHNDTDTDKSSTTSRETTKTDSNALGTAPTMVKPSAKDFLFGKMLGEGSFSTVYLAKDINSKTEYAIKVCEKAFILREKKIQYIQREKEALNLLSNASPYFVKLYCTFQDPTRLYFVLTYARNHELLFLIKKLNGFDVALTRFYTCQLTLALEVLHRKGIVHRDLKPENILLDENFNILITDFGSAKILGENRENVETTVADSGGRRRNSFVGSANFVSPELLTDKPATHACDLWALGCIVFQMFTGHHCFSEGSDYLIFNKVLNLGYELPDDMPEAMCDLVRKLLVIEGSARLGATDEVPYTSIREHQLFDSIDWNALGKPPIPEQLVPQISDSENTEDCYERAEPGLDKNQMARLIGLHGEGPVQSIYVEEHFNDANNSSDNNDESLAMMNLQNRAIQRNIADVSINELESRLAVQKNDNKYHDLVDGNLILKQGLIDKRKGLIARRRMFLATLGPHLYYVEPNTMVRKGEVPWTKDLRVEVKNFKVFYIHTPNRTYYLEDPEGYALQWQKDIEDVHQFYFGDKT